MSPKGHPMQPRAKVARVLASREEVGRMISRYDEIQKPRREVLIEVIEELRNEQRRALRRMSVYLAAGIVAAAVLGVVF